MRLRKVYRLCGFLLLFCCSSGKAQNLILTPKESVTPGKSAAWSPLFQASWDRLNQANGGPSNGSGNAAIEALDSFRWDEKSVMPPGKYDVRISEGTPEFLKESNEALVKQFGPDAGIRYLNPIPEGGLVVVGHLAAGIDYPVAFFDSGKRRMPFYIGDQKVYARFFGTAGKFSRYYGKSVKLLSVAKERLCIEVESQDQSLILYLPTGAPDRSLSATMAVVKALRDDFANLADEKGNRYPYLREKDVVKIPHVDFSVEENLTERLNSWRNTPGSGPRRVSFASQSIAFQMNEKGAKVVSHTEIAEPFGAPPKIVPRHFIYDRPFYIFLWRKEATFPYFACYVNSVDLLQTTQTP
ncbi:MAG: hypothetical protein P1U89_24545 [Verrucomicrobiales bacterium]|nr:hypothetical protein [Verrucomicrobiales bacterium]